MLVTRHSRRRRTTRYRTSLAARWACWRATAVSSVSDGALAACRYRIMAPRSLCHRYRLNTYRDLFMPLPMTMFTSKSFLWYSWSHFTYIAFNCILVVNGCNLVTCWSPPTIYSFWLVYMIYDCVLNELCRHSPLIEIHAKDMYVKFHVYN